MDDKLIQLRLLLLRKRMGVNLDPEEQAELDILMQLPQAGELYQKISQLPAQDLVNLVEESDPGKAIANAHAEATRLRTRRKKQQIQWAAAAACFVLAAGISTFLVIKQSATSPPTVKTGSPAPPGATLLMPDGQIIALSDSGHQQVIAGISAQNRVLSIQPSGAGDPDSWTELSVPSRLDYQIILPDNSKVWLNSETAIAFSPGKRQVRIKNGEAYFEISADAQQPFTVFTPRGEIQVLGTSFNVNAYDDLHIVTSLVNGKVMVKAGIDQQTLAAGKEAIQIPGQPITVQPFDTSLVLGWQVGKHYFKDATLREVAVMLQRWFATPLIIDDPSLNNVQVRGVLSRREPLQAFLDQMNLLGVATFYWDDQQRLHCRK